MAANVISQVGSVPVEKPVDREKICPLLLRIFCANSRHNNLSEYARSSVPANELQVYTWMDCSLRELTGLIKEVNPDARKRGTTFDFAIVSPDRSSPRYQMRDIGSTMNGQRGLDDAKTLCACKFEIGDYMDVAITMPAPDGMRSMGRRPFNDRGGFRESFRGDRNGGGFDRERRRFSPERERF